MVLPEVAPILVLTFAPSGVFSEMILPVMPLPQLPVFAPSWLGAFSEVIVPAMLSPPLPAVTAAAWERVLILKILMTLPPPSAVLAVHVLSHHRRPPGHYKPIRFHHNKPSSPLVSSPLPVVPPAALPVPRESSQDVVTADVL